MKQIPVCLSKYPANWASALHNCLEAACISDTWTDARCGLNRKRKHGGSRLFRTDLCLIRRALQTCTDWAFCTHMGRLRRDSHWLHSALGTCACSTPRCRWNDEKFFCFIPSSHFVDSKRVFWFCAGLRRWSFFLYFFCVFVFFAER